MSNLQFRIDKETFWVTYVKEKHYVYGINRVDENNNPITLDENDNILQLRMISEKMKNELYVEALKSKSLFVKNKNDFHWYSYDENDKNKKYRHFVLFS